MNRRKFVKITLAGLAGTTSGAYILSTCFKTPLNLDNKSTRLLSEEDRNAASPWIYSKLDPDVTADIAYKSYDNGSCMYGVFKSVVYQLGEKFGEPYKSFPYDMMKFGRGGIGDYGSVCGALNGIGAVIGLFVRNKKNQNYLIADLFSWYEKTELPVYVPKIPQLKLNVTTSVSSSILCHVSAANWGKSSGYIMNSSQQKERCRRLTADVVRKTVVILNDFFDDKYIASNRLSETVNGCIKCHNKGGKLSNTRGQMDCASCHSTSLGHRVFADIHYKMMKTVSDKP